MKVRFVYKDGNIRYWNVDNNSGRLPPTIRLAEPVKPNCAGYTIGRIPKSSDIPPTKEFRLVQYEDDSSEYIER